MRTPPALVATLLVFAVAVMLIAPFAPRPESVVQFRIHAYGSHAAYFGTLMAAVAVAASTWWNAPLRRLLATCGIAFVVVMVLNVLDVDIASDVAKVVFGTAAGLAFVHAIERPWWLLPIGITVPLADAWSVFSSRGVTNAVVDRAREEPRWIDWPTIATPIAGYPYEQFGRLGTVDILFAALFLGAAARWQLGIRRAAVALTLGLLATSVLVFEQSSYAIPALPLLCLAFLIACGPSLIRDVRDARRGDPSSPGEGRSR